MVSPLTTTPDVLVYNPPFTEYVPPLTDISVAAVMPATVMLLELWVLDAATAVTAVKLNASGMTSSAVANSDAIATHHRAR
jgi:hypothetical protein